MAGGRINALERRTGLSRDGTRAPTQGPEWPGRLWGAPLKSDSPILNLLRAKNGLDNRDHFRNRIDIATRTVPVRHGIATEGWVVFSPPYEPHLLFGKVFE